MNKPRITYSNLRVAGAATFLITAMTALGGSVAFSAEPPEEATKKSVSADETKQLVGGDIGIPQKKAKTTDAQSLSGGDIGIPQKTPTQKEDSK